HAPQRPLTAAVKPASVPGSDGPLNANRPRGDADPEGPLAAEFLRAIQAGDEAARRALIDWLQEQGDPRGEQAARDPAKLPSLFGLRPEHAAYLRQFSATRRMKRDPGRAAGMPDPARAGAGLPLGRDAEYFVGGTGFHGQGRDASILDYNAPPAEQPGLWCKWVPTDDAAGIQWDGGEKFYSYVEWLKYLLQHFLTPWGYVVHGRVEWQGEEDEDRGTIHVRENRIEVKGGRRRR
ncbi:MAG: hypothetical protein ACRC33_10240, partial [Gemmataceae bacterium]